MRRLWLFLLVLAWPVAVSTAGEKVYRLGELAPSAASLEITRDVTLPVIAKLGFEIGRNLILEERAGDAMAMPELARELLRTKPDAIIAIGADAIRASSEATSAVPIVMFGANPVNKGLATSFARPGGNVTGVVIMATELDGKRLDLLHEAVPAARRIAALMLPSAPERQASEREMRGVAASTGVELLPFDAAGPEEYPAVFAAMQAAGAQALLVMAHSSFNRDAALIAQLALGTGLPTVCEWAEMAQAGCLLGYGPSRTELRRRTAHFVARIFQGTAPSDLPIEQPTRYEFVINLKTAKALGLSVPQSSLARADEVIE
jgi:putative tryptophan/tyrosine transport system substrate-binding protein